MEDRFLQCRVVVAGQEDDRHRRCADDLDNARQDRLRDAPIVEGVAGQQQQVGAHGLGSGDDRLQAGDAGQGTRHGLVVDMDV